MKKTATKTLLFVSFLFALLAFNSCRNIFDDSVDGSDQETEKIDEVSSQLPEQIPDQPAAPAAPVVIPKVLFGGVLSVNGALPEKMEKALTEPDYNDDVTEDEGSTNRTARPSVPTPGTAYEYYVKATNPEGQSVEAVAQLDANDGKYKYQIALEIDINWTFEAGFRKKAVGEEGDPDYVAAQNLMIDAETASQNSFQTMLSVNMDTTSHDFILKPSQTDGGKGRLDLSMKEVPDGVSLKLFVPDPVTGAAVEWLDSSVLDIHVAHANGDNNYIRSKNDAAGNPVFNIDSGAYDVTLIFYKTFTDSGITVPAYISYQTINIFDNMTTDSWINESESLADAAIDSTGNFQLTSTLMQNFLDNTLYVGAPAGVNVTPDDTNNTGAPYSPLATLRRAFQLIQVQGNGSSYRIYVTANSENPQTGNFVIPSAITTEKASSIEISGNGNTMAVLDGNKTGTVLKVESAVPVTLKNIKIINGKSVSDSPTAGKGGGLHITSSGNVTLGPGVHVGVVPEGVTSPASGETACSNYAASGAGIYCEGNLTVKKGAEVSYNYAVGGSGGGGIYCKNGTLKIESGAKILQNGSSGCPGAGIGLEAANFTMTGGEVSNNKTSSFGGGVYNSGSSTGFVISGGTISGNKSGMLGGAIYLGNDTTAENIISGNVTIEKNSSNAGGGGIYAVSGVLNLQGGIIKNNSAKDLDNTWKSGGAVGVSNSAVLKMSGSVKIPYGVTEGTSTLTGVGKNDVYLAVQSGTLKTITLESDLSNHSESNKIYLTLGVWERDKTVVTAGSGFTITDAIKNKFSYTTQGWISKIESNTIKLDSPIYVKNGGSASATGTSADPFDNIQHALSAMTDSNKDYVIYVDGTVTGSQTIPAENLSSPALFSARSITIEGVNNGTLDGQNSVARVLEIRATCDVTIKNLTIKGANSTTDTSGGGIASITSGKLILGTGTLITGNTSGGDGGGVYKSDGTVEIKSGVEISGNTAKCGGGLATLNSATVIMSGGVIKGNTSNSTGTYHGGGGLYLNGGKFFMYGNAVIGTDAANLTEYTVENGCNVASNNGGGLYTVSQAEVYIGYKELDSSNNPVLATGEEAFTGGIMGNYCAGNGAGVYMAYDKEFVLGAGFISNNKTATNGCGGAIYNTQKCIISGGTISGNIATNGGAIYNAGSLKLDGSAKIPSTGTAGSNDILLAAVGTPAVQKVVTVCASTFTYHNTSNNPIYLTLPAWERGTKILEAADTSVTISTASNYFKLTDGGWNKAVYDSNSDGIDDSVKIESPIYVAGSDPRVCTGTPGHAAETTGTTAHPFDSIEAACSLFTEDGAQYEIKIDGHVTGAQAIPDTIHGQSLTISGYDTTKGRHTINGNSSGSVLTINTAVPVRLQNLTIYGGGGTTAVNGGGINITKNGAKVGLIKNIYVQKNQATAKGGGIYVCSGATLYLAGGTTYIGKESCSATSDSSTPLTDYINIAEEGGGIYSDGYIKFGYTISEAGIESGKSGNICIYGNVATKNGGGVYFTGSLTTIGSTSHTNYIRYNYSGEKGGGIYAASTDTDIKKSIQLLYLENNKSAYGGGIYISSSSRYESSSFLISNNEATENGGGVYNEGYFELGDAYRTTVKSNKAKNGGAIYNAGTLELWNGTIGGSGENDPNTASLKGGAIYVSASSTIKYNAGSGKYVDIQYGSAEKPNDIYLEKTTVGDTTTNAVITISSSNLSSASGTITLADWKRGEPVLIKGTTTITDTMAGYFTFTEPGWNNKVVNSGNGTQLDSPIYVVDSSDADNTRPEGFGKGLSIEAGAVGTKDKPYASIADALTALESGVTPEIVIAGTVKGRQSISGTIGTSSLTIKGYIASGETSSSAKLDAGGAGSALTVNKSGLTVTITDLTITGGTGTEVSSKLYGGGIYINAGNVQLTNGAVVNGNTADIGGGVYLNAGNLYINGSAVVGKPGVTECAQNVSGKYGNKADTSGGGIGVQNGTLWLGYTPPAGSSTTPAEAATTGGVLYNLVCSGGERHGGGIDNNSGTLNIAHGYVSYNYACSTGTGDNDIGCGGGISTAYVMKLSGDAEISHNKSAYGGGVYITRDSTNGSFTMEGGKVTLNESEVQHGQYGYGGGVAIGASGSFTLSGGELSSNEAAVNGGAVWHNGAGFEIKGTVTKIPAGTNDSNNIAFYSSSKRIKVTGSTSHGNGEIAVTPASWTRGSQIFEDGSTTTYFSKFKITDPEWSIVAFNDGSKTTGRIDADIYVAPTSSTTTVNSVTYGKGAAATAGGLGTKAKPYSTIADAVAQCWGGPNDTGTGVSRTINIVGTITGAQEITSAVNASGITLKGVNTSATLNGGMSSTSATKKSTLTISTVVPVTIQTLTVKGGYSSNNGGGILVNGVGGASLTLGENAKVSGNTATANGGGIYFKGTNAPGGTGSLIMNSTSAVSGNTATGTSSKGGGIYLQYASLYMSGSALIGDTAGTIAATSADGGHSNMADSGGGVYCDTSANIKLGYASASDASGTDLSETYGIRHNYATRFGGGVYMAAGSLTLKTGKIFANGTSATSGNNGGGVYVSNVASFTMYGGTVAKNKAYNGGGVCIDGNSSAGGTFTMSGGTIGDSSSGVTSAATTTGNAYSNYAAKYGGGLYTGEKTSVTLNGGYISYNYSVEYGGGIYTNSDTTFKANAKYNTSAISGGGIYSYGSGNTLTMSGGTIYGNKATGTSPDTDNQKFLGGGGVWFDGTFKMSGGTIQGNSATWYGGGVATYEGFFYMSGSAVIGDKSKEALPDESATTSPTANRAKYGGGFAATNDADVYLGYSGKTGTTLNASSLANGGIYYNYASQNGGGYYQIGGRKLIMGTGNISYNKAAASASKGGGIYIESGLQMSGGTITGNYATNGGAVFLKNCVYEASGSIYIPYSSAVGSANKENTVQMQGSASKITLTGSLTDTHTTVMTVEPHTWAIGTLVADKNTSISLDNFKTSVGKIGIVKNGLYSKVELSTSQGSTTGVVGVDMNNITETDVKNYISGKTLSAESSGKWAKEGLSYFVVQYVGTGAKNGKVGIVRVHDNRDSTSPATKGKILANGIGFLSSPNAVSTTEKTYNTSSTSTMLSEGLNIFDTSSSSWWDGDQVGVAHSSTSGELLVYYFNKVKGIRMD